MTCLRIRLDMRIWQCCKKNERALRVLYAGAHTNQMDGSTPGNPQRTYRSEIILQYTKKLSSFVALCRWERNERGYAERVCEFG